MTRRMTMLLGISLYCLTAFAPAQSTQPKAAPAAAATHKAPVAPSPGERAFQNNCSRCHYAPEDLNPRLTGTVVRHMRVRANLSKEDERLIMSYFLP